MSEKTRWVQKLADGKLSSVEIGKIVGASPRYVRKIMTGLCLARLRVGGQPGSRNHQFVSGRRIDPDGYVLVTAPDEHPFARQRKNRKGKLIFEHRLVMEKKLGRFLLPTEVVDHIDGLTLHNDPSNLRLFETNGNHLNETISGQPHRVSASGLLNIKTRFDQDVIHQPVDIYWIRRKRGDVRLRQILLAALSLGTDSPFLLGTTHHLRKAQIYELSRPMIILELEKLNQRWEEDLAR